MGVGGTIETQHPCEECNGLRLWTWSKPDICCDRAHIIASFSDFSEGDRIGPPWPWDDAPPVCGIVTGLSHVSTDEDPSLPKLIVEEIRQQQSPPEGQRVDATGDSGDRGVQATPTPPTQSASQSGDSRDKSRVVNNIAYK